MLLKNNFFVRYNLLLILFVLITSCKTQQSKLWKDFKKTSKQKKTTPLLPDFSYAGYKYSEVGIPNVKYKVFNVLNFGATVNDTLSDKQAVIDAIKAASKNGEGIIYFPKGKYYINTESDNTNSIFIKNSRIVFRGEDRNSTVLFFKKDLPPRDPNKLWSCPMAIKTSVSKGNKYLAKITSSSKRETKTILVDDASKVKEGEWVIVSVLNNDKDLIKYDIYPLVASEKWKSILNKGVKVNERHQIKEIKGNQITFFEPIHYDIDPKHNWSLYTFEHLKSVGFENITFEGNWKGSFKHHKNAQHDGGWSILEMGKVVNSWIRNCRFKNVNRAGVISASAACTAIDITVEGNIGHSALSATGGSTGIVFAMINDKAGMHHSVGVGGGSTTGTVIWRSKYASHTSFESHASQPRCTLFDNVEGGFFRGRAGGAIKNLPNHGRYLVLWNFNETDEPEENFSFLSKNSWWWKVVPPIVVGFHGAGTTFAEDEVQILESLGSPVNPKSLFEEQLKLRLGKLPDWIKERINK